MRALLAALTLLLAAAPAGAQQLPVGWGSAAALDLAPMGDFNPIAVARGPRGRTLVVHIAMDGVHVVRIDGRGRRIGEVRQLSRHTDALSPSVAFDRRNRRWLVAWTHGTGQLYVVRTRVVSLRGRPLGAARVMATAGPSEAVTAPALAWVHRLGLVALEQRVRLGAPGGTLDLRRLDAAGRPRSRPMRLDSSAALPPEGTLVATGRTGALIAYRTGAAYSVAQILTARLTPRGRLGRRRRLDPIATRADRPVLSFHPRSRRVMAVFSRKGWWDSGARALFPDGRPAGPVRELEPMFDRLDGLAPHGRAGWLLTATRTWENDREIHGTRLDAGGRPGRIVRLTAMGTDDVGTTWAGSSALAGDVLVFDGRDDDRAGVHLFSRVLAP